MAKVIFDKSSFQSALRKEVAGKMLFDFKADTPKTSMGYAYTTHLSQLTEEIATVVAGKLNRGIRQHYSAGISAVQHLLKTGIDGTPSEDTLTPPTSIPLKDPTAKISTKKWQPFTKKYYKEKGKRKYKARQNKFWLRRRTAGLSAAFGAFAGPHKSAVKSKKSVVTINTRGFKATGRANSRFYRFDLTFYLPVPSQGEGYLQELLQTSFISGKPYKGIGYGLEDNFAILGYLEGTPVVTATGTRKEKEKAKGLSRHRPFISALMASKGRHFKKLFDAELERATKSSSPRIGDRYTESVRVLKNPVT